MNNQPIDYGLYCWNCEANAIYPRAEVIADHPKASRRAYVCDVCGAAGDREDFSVEPAHAGTSVKG